MKATYVPPGYDPTQYEPPSRQKRGCGRWLWIGGGIFALVVGFGLGAGATYHAAPSPTRTETPTLTGTPGPSPTPTITPTATITTTPGPITATPMIYITVLPTGATSQCFYTVEAGDTLAGIAARLGTTLAALAKQNQIANVNRIRVGQRLTIGCGP